MKENRYRILLILLVLTLVFSIFTLYISSHEPQRTSAKAMALYSVDRDEFLYDKNGDTPLPMASTTKIMTALIAIETIPEESIIKIDERAVGIEGSSLYLSEGECFSRDDLLYGLLLQSANDAACALAYAVSDSIEGFVSLMNEKASSIGLKNTSFENPHGLDGDNHYTTAKDLARLTATALKNETFSTIVKTYRKTISSDKCERTLINHNRLLKSYAGANGVKTGYTKKSGRCLVSSAERNGVWLVVSTLNAPDDWHDHTVALDFGFSTLSSVTLINKYEESFSVPINSGLKTTVFASNSKELSAVLKKHEKSEIVKETVLSGDIDAPVYQNQPLGYIVYRLHGKEIGRVPIVAQETVYSLKKKSYFNILNI